MGVILARLRSIGAEVPGVATRFAKLAHAAPADSEIMAAHIGPAGEARFGIRCMKRMKHEDACVYLAPDRALWKRGGPGEKSGLFAGLTACARHDAVADVDLVVGAGPERRNTIAP